MTNVKMAVTDGRFLKIEVDLEEEHGPSKSGKNVIIGTTSGIVQVPDCPDVKLGLNVFKRGG